MPPIPAAKKVTKLYQPSKDIRKFIPAPNEATAPSTSIKFGEELRSFMDEVSNGYEGTELVVATAIPRFNVIPTGIFALDMCLGGGWAEGNPAMVFGNGNSGKTTSILKAIAGLHRKYPRHTAMLCDVETSFDPGWADIQGVDRRRLLVLRPKSGEEACDIMLGAATVEDIGMIILDSIPVLVPQKDYEDSVADAVVGTRARMLGRLSANILQTITTERSRKTPLNPYGHFMTWFSVNSWRDKITMFGDPRTLPGGQWQHTFHNEKVELIAKEVLENISGGAKRKEKGDGEAGKKSNKGTDVSVTEHTFKIHKAKIPGMRSGEYKMNLDPTSKIPMGGVDDIEAVAAWAKRLGVLRQSGANLVSDIFDYRISNKEELHSKVLNDRDFGDWLRTATIVAQRIALKMPPLPPDGYLVGMPSGKLYKIAEDTDITTAPKEAFISDTSPVAKKATVSRLRE
jgi:RecA/RadA recombinase